MRTWDLHRFKRNRDIHWLHTNPSSICHLLENYKYHCTVLKHGGKVKHWKTRTNCTLIDTRSMFFCACNNQEWWRFGFGWRIRRTYNGHFFFRSDKISLCLFFSGIFSQKVPARGRKNIIFHYYGLTICNVPMFSNDHPTWFVIDQSYLS